MSYPPPLARHLEPDDNPDHDAETCATDPCFECLEIAAWDMAEKLADSWRDDDV